jgi:hypothetical protein
MLIIKRGGIKLTQGIDEQAWLRIIIRIGNNTKTTLISPTRIRHYCTYVTYVQ